jgi:hypothetical protein
VKFTAVRAEIVSPESQLAVVTPEKLSMSTIVFVVAAQVGDQVGHGQVVRFVQTVFWRLTFVVCVFIVRFV